jgi:hypothetical protein
VSKSNFKRRGSKLKYRLLTQVASLVPAAETLREMVYKKSWDCGEDESEEHKFGSTFAIRIAHNRRSL